MCVCVCVGGGGGGGEGERKKLTENDHHEWKFLVLDTLEGTLGNQAPRL